MKKYIPGKGFMPVSAISHSKPVRSMPSIKGPKLAKKPAKASRKKARKS